MRFPFITDPKVNQKSLTLTLTVVSFLLAVSSIVTSHVYLSCLPASVLSVLLFALCMLFYRLRKLDSFDINLKSGEISAKDTEDKA